MSNLITTMKFKISIMKYGASLMKTKNSKVQEIINRI